MNNLFLSTITITILCASSSVLSAPSSVFERNAFKVIQNTDQLAKWCKISSYTHFSAKTDKVFNWRQHPRIEGDNLVVRGKWRVNGEETNVECRVAKGKSHRFVTMTFSSEQNTTR